MADPKLKTVAPAAAPRRVLLNSGTVPTKRVTLLGAGGRASAPKTPQPAATPAPEATPTPAVEVTPEPVVDEEAIKAQQEYDRQMEEYNRQMEEYNRQMAEYEAQMQAQAEAEAAAAAQAEAEAQAAAQAQAEAEAAAAAQAEAAAQAAAAEEAPAVVAAPQPVAAPTKTVAAPKLTTARPAGAKVATPKLAVARPAAAKPALSPKPVAQRPAPAASTPLPPGTPPPPAIVEDPVENPEEVAMTEEELAQHQAIMEKLQYETSKKPFHKKPVFYVACGILAVMAGVVLTMVQSSKADAAAIEKDREKIKAVLYRAIDINQKEVFNLEDAKTKNVDIKCTKEDADLLLHIILNHDETDETGNLRYGPNTVGTAMHACVLLGIASELDSKICNQVFKTLAANATKMHPELLDELLDRLTKTNIKNLNKKLNDLAKPLNPKDDADILTVIWTYKERLATTKDVDKVISYLKIKDLDSNLNNAMRAYMLSLFKKMDDMGKKQEIGKQIYDIVKGDDDKLGTQNIMRMLAFSCVPEALEYYKGKMTDKKNWQKYSYFFGSWQQDEIVGYIKELRSSCNEEDDAEAKYIATMDAVIMKVLTQDRPRSIEDAKKLLNEAYSDFNADTSRMQELLIAVDENPDDAAANAEYEKLCRIFLQKEKVVKNLASCKEYHDWIDAILNDIEAECNATHGSHRHNQLAALVEKTRNTIKENELKNAASTAKHAKRMELED